MTSTVHARPRSSASTKRSTAGDRMADPEGNEFTVVLPLPAHVAVKAYGERGLPG
jgi:hypothetical protein